jgi:hypothetical protein
MEISRKDFLQKLIKFCQQSDPEAELIPKLREFLASQQQKGVPIDMELVQAPGYLQRVITFLRRGEETFSRLSDLTSGDFCYFLSRPKFVFLFPIKILVF